MARPRQYVDAPMMPCPQCKLVKPAKEFYPSTSSRPIEEIKRYATCCSCHLENKRKSWARGKGRKAYLEFWKDFSSIAEHATNDGNIPELISRLLVYSTQHRLLIGHEPSLYAQIIKAINEVYPLSETMRGELEEVARKLEVDEVETLALNIKG